LYPRPAASGSGGPCGRPCSTGPTNKTAHGQRQTATARRGPTDPRILEKERERERESKRKKNYIKKIIQIPIEVNTFLFFSRPPSVIFLSKNLTLYFVVYYIINSVKNL
jgi:hypothetical protein